MKQILLVLIILTSFLSANAAEMACTCFENSISHSEEQAVAPSDHHHDGGASEKNENKTHCQHTCTQCHFAALVPRHFIFASDSVVVRLSFLTTNEIPRNVSQLLYRPPIS